MANFTNTEIKDTYQRVLQIDGGVIQNGLGQTVNASITSLTGSFSGSLEGTASYALTASHALNAGSAFPFTGDAQITGSLVVSGSFNAHGNGPTNNVIIGEGAGTIVTDNSINNVFVGKNAGGNDNDYGDANTLVGMEAGYLGNQTGNTSIGYNAGRGWGTTGVTPIVGYNVAIGYQSSYNAATRGTGIHNVTIGSLSGRNLTSANGNILLGYYAGFNHNTGTGNIIIGSGSLGIAGESNQLRIGHANTIAISASLTTGDVIFSGIITSTTASHNYIQSSVPSEPIKLDGKDGGVSLHYVDGGDTSVLEISDGITLDIASETTKLTLDSSGIEFKGSINTAITASSNISSSGYISASSFIGDGSGLTNLPASSTFPFTGDAIITGSLVVSASATSQSLSVIGSGSTVFDVVGSVGTLFSVDDDLTGTLFTANDISGLPVLQASASGEVYIGKSPQSLYTTAVIGSNTANVTQSIYGLSTSSYAGAFFEYTAFSGSHDARAGSIMAIWSGSSVNFTETTTTDFGDTSNLLMQVAISQSQAQIQSYSTTAGYKIKTIVKAI